MNVTNIRKSLIYFGLLGSFISPLSSLAYLSIFFKKLKINRKDFFYLIILTFFLILKVLISDSELIDVLNVVRFYFGFVIFYLVFKTLQISLQKFFIFFLIVTLIEVVLINFFIDPKLMPNFPSEEAYSHFSTGFQRPYSFSGNASVASTLIVVLGLLYAVNLLKKLFVFINVIIFSSGAGLFSYVLSLFYKKKLFKILLIFSLLITVLIFFSKSQLPINSKVSYDYINLLWEYKQYQINAELVNFSTLELLIGSIDKAVISGYGSDFGYLYFYKSFGLIGVIFLFWIIIRSLNKKNFFPLIILLLSSFHYPVIFFLTGQIIFAYLLNYKKNSWEE